MRSTTHPQTGYSNTGGAAIICVLALVICMFISNHGRVQLSEIVQQMSFFPNKCQQCLGSLSLCHAEARHAQRPACSWESATLPPRPRVQALECSPRCIACLLGYLHNMLGLCNSCAWVQTHPMAAGNVGHLPHVRTWPPPWRLLTTKSTAVTTSNNRTLIITTGTARRLGNPPACSRHYQ
jgi:hypothetical protein